MSEEKINDINNDDKELDTEEKTSRTLRQFLKDLWVEFGGNELTDEGCYLTTACMRHQKDNFDDNCEELETLRWFRDNFVSEEDKKHYYETAPEIVRIINEQENSKEIYDNIYNYVISPCVKAIKKEDYLFAYNRYMGMVTNLEEKYLRPELENRLVRTLKNR